MPASQEHRTTACLSMPCRYRAGIPWRDLPARFGDFQVAHLHHGRWSYSGVWQQVFEALAQQAGNEYAMIGSTIVRAHQHGAGTKGGASQAIGHSRSGLSAKIHAAADALGHRISSHAKAGARPLSETSRWRTCTTVAGATAVYGNRSLKPWRSRPATSTR